MKLYKATGCNDILKMVYEKRNKVNSAVDRAKSEFITSKLRQNFKKKKKFWQSINALIKDNSEIDINNITFRDPDTGSPINSEDVPDFLNTFFATIAERTRGPDANIRNTVNDDLYDQDYPGFDLTPVTPETVLTLLNDMDINMSSCIDGINMGICKIMVKQISKEFAKIYSNSLFRGIFPKEMGLFSSYTLTKNR